MNQLLTPFHALNDIHRLFDERTLYNGNSDWVPQVDIRENEEGYSVAVDVPGIDPADVEITLHNNVLAIRGERGERGDASESRDYRRRERVSGSFVRQFTLPNTVDESAVKASASNGVIDISIPRVQAAKPLTITVN